MTVATNGVTTFGITRYGTYLPRHRLDRVEIGATLGSGGGRGERVVAAFDEDSTTMAVEAARAAGVTAPQAIWFATTSPAYLDKTNAAAVHAALGGDNVGFAADLAGSARSGVGALRAAAAAGGVAVAADVRTGQPGSADERAGGDAAVAIEFGTDGVVAAVLAQASRTTEVLDRWRTPGQAHADTWEERFGLAVYLPLFREVAADALNTAGLDSVDHLVVVSPNSGVTKKPPLTGNVSTTGSPIGHAGAADLGLGLAAALDVAEPGQTILAISAADGADALLLRATDQLPDHRQAVPVLAQLAAGQPVPYATYLTWRGHLVREPPRRPEPDRPGAPPSARGEAWKFAFTGSRCTACGFVHLPPSRVCRSCRAVDEMTPAPLAGATGTIATYTVDRLAFSPSPPVVDAVIDFADGGRATLEVADAVSEELAVGVPVELVFRRLFTAQGVHNYFWKARVLSEGRVISNG